MTDPKDHDPTPVQPAKGAEDKTVEQTAVQPTPPAEPAATPEAVAPAETTTEHQEQAPAAAQAAPPPPAGPPPGWVPAQPQPTGPGGFKRFVRNRATQLVGVGLVGVLLGGGIVGIAVGASRHDGPKRPGISRQHDGGGFGDRGGHGGPQRGTPGGPGGYNAPGSPGGGPGI